MDLTRKQLEAELTVDLDWRERIARAIETSRVASTVLNDILGECETRIVNVRRAIAKLDLADAEQNLLPCPFCGSSPYHYEVNCGHGIGCGCGARQQIHSTVAIAIKAWNRRSNT